MTIPTVMRKNYVRATFTMWLHLHVNKRAMVINTKCVLLLKCVPINRRSWSTGTQLLHDEL